MKILSHFSRITTPGREFIPQIDGLRFLAIIAVIAYHVWGIGTFHLGQPGYAGDWVAKCMKCGCLGVQLFFVISGFILALPFAKFYLAGGKKIYLRDYYIRRVTRIEPPYVIQLLIVFIFTALVLRRFATHQQLYGAESWLRYTVPHMLASLGYAHQFFYAQYPYPNIVLWSLEVEVQFYILAPFLAKIFSIRKTLIRRIVIAAAAFGWPWLMQILGWQNYELRVGLLRFLPYFLMGFLFVEIFLAGKLMTARRQILWDLIFILCGVGIVLFQESRFLNYLLPWIFLLVCVAAFCGKILSRFLTTPALVVIGGMCYTIYMYHWLMISVFIRGTIHLQTKIWTLDLVIQFLTLTILILVFCAVLFILFERPFMRKNWPTQFRQFLFPAKSK